ncbi:MAG TPA: hypothetical protein VFA15_09025, partial [Nitrososphaera sp.]|nr:hypothetical protein [Nitrososphaera sp.]
MSNNKPLNTRRPKKRLEAVVGPRFLRHMPASSALGYNSKRADVLRLSVHDDVDGVSAWLRFAGRVNRARLKGSGSHYLPEARL